MNRPQLILDVAGVIVTNLSPSYWEEISKIAGVTYESLKTQFKNDIREAFWTGKISEEAFWQWLKTQCASVETQYAQKLLSSHLTRLPAMDHLSNWSQLADIHLLSNHRNEWLDPLLNPIKPYIKSITISSVVGFCKADPKIYEIVNSKIDTKQAAIFVDDQEKNMKPAKDLGWNTLIADKEGQWIEYLTVILQKQIKI